MVVLNSVETATHSRGPLCIGQQQCALLEWQDIIYPDDQNGQGLRRHRGARGGGRHEGRICGGRIILAP